jgi:hypothetical protein
MRAHNFVGYREKVLPINAVPSFRFQTDLGELSALYRIRFYGCENPEEKGKAALTELSERSLKFAVPKNRSWRANRDNCLGLSGRSV